MKLVTVITLALGMLCNSILAAAEGPVPLKALMADAGAEPVMIANAGADDKSLTGSTQQSHKTMTRGGKIMAGVGVGMLAIGATGLIGTAVWRGPVSPSDKHKLYAAGSGVMATGVVLIVFGSHRRSAK